MCPLGAGLDEELHFHLLELAHPEDELPRNNLVAEGLADLSDAERQLHTAAFLDVEVVDENTLSCLGPQVDDAAFATNGAQFRFEHEVELANVCPISTSRIGIGNLKVFDECLDCGPVVGIHGGFKPAVDAVDLRLAVEDSAVGAAELCLVKGVPEPLGGLGDVFFDFCLDFGNMIFDQNVRSVALFAILVVDERVIECVDVTGGLPSGGVHENAGVDAHNVLVHSYHGGPPVVLNVVLQFSAQLAVVVSRGKAVVDFARREYKAVFFGVAYDFFEEVVTHEFTF